MKEQMKKVLKFFVIAMVLMLFSNYDVYAADYAVDKTTTIPAIGTILYEGDTITYTSGTFRVYAEYVISGQITCDSVNDWVKNYAIKSYEGITKWKVTENVTINQNDCLLVKLEEYCDTWSYSVDTNNKITATCKGECGNVGDHTATLTITASETEYDKVLPNNAITVSSWSPSGFKKLDTASSVYYVSQDGTSYPESTNIPTVIGDYYAKVYLMDSSSQRVKDSGGVNDVCAKVAFTIYNNDPIFDNCFDGKNLTKSSYSVGGKYFIDDGVKYTFAGWYTDKNGNGEELTGEPVDLTTYYAKWTKTIDDEVYTVWTLDDSMPDVGGNYVLAKDVTLDEMWTVHSGMVIALDGHTIKGGGINDNSYQLTFVICSEEDMNNAINIGTYTNKYTFEIADDFEITEFIRLKDRYLVINGNDHTITGASGTASNPKMVQQMFAIDSVNKDSRNNVKINDLNIVCSERFKNAIAVQNKDDNKKGIHLTLTNVSIDHSESIADSAALLNFGSDIKIKGEFTIITGENDCYAIGMDLATQDAKLVFDDEAEVSIVDNRRVQNQEDRALIFFSSRDAGHSATVTGKYLTENLGAIDNVGYNQLATVTLETNGGSDIDPISVTKYCLISGFESEPIFSDYTFAGWYADEKCENAWNFDTDKVVEDMTLYAKWTKTIDDEVYTVLTLDDSMPDVGGNYALAKDVTLDYMWVVHSGMVIALDGHTIKGTSINDNSYKLTFVICSEEDMNNAINIGTYTNKYTFEIADDFEITEFIRLKDRYLVINGNDHTITGASGTASNSKMIQQMFAIDSVNKDSRNNVKINDLNIVCSERFKNAIAVQNKDDNKKGIHLTLTNVSIDHSDSIADSAALLNFGSDIKINGKFTIITGENDCYAIGMDLATQDAKLVFDDEAEVSIVDNRSMQKEVERALIFYSSRDAGHSATVSGKYVDENLEAISNIGYNQIAAIWFETNDGSYVEPVGVAKHWLVPRPANDPELSNYTFGGWYSDEKCENAWNFESDKVAGNMTLYAKWIKKSDPKASVFGAVTDGTNALSDATVELMLGNEKVAATNTNSYGLYSFDNVENGVYNIVVTRDSKVKTAMVNVNQVSSFDVGIIVLPSKEVSSKVELKNVDTISKTVKTDVASTVVGGIDAIAENENPSGTDKVTIKLTVEPKASNTSDMQQAEIKDKAKNKTIEFIDMTLTKQINEELPTDIGNSNTELLTINMPFDTTGIDADSITVYRYHDSEATSLEKINDEADKADATFELKDKCIKIYAKKFSTYAIGYTAEGENSNKDNSNKNSKPTSYASGKSKYSLSVISTENGVVEVSDEKPLEGSTVTITVNPNKGYVVDTLKVNQKTGEEVKVTTKESGKTYTFIMPKRNTEVTVTFKEGKNYFVDVSKDAYYYEPVNWAVENGITSGIDETHFGPKDITTRAQMVTFLWKLAGSPEPTTTSCKFTDVVRGSYYEKAVLWAVEKRITHGTTATTFSPKANIKRGQAVTLIHNYKGNEVTSGENRFTDVKVNAYYYNSVLWAVENGITSGTTSTEFSPNTDCTRAQIVTFLYNCSNN